MTSPTRYPQELRERAVRMVMEHGGEYPSEWAALRPSLEPAQYLAVRYTERLAEAGAVGSVGSRGDSYDNALAESFNGLYKTELIRKDGPWCGLEDVEYATLEYVDWFNQRRLHGHLGFVSPAEFETTHYDERAPALLAVSH